MEKAVRKAEGNEMEKKRAPDGDQLWDAQS